LSQILISSSGNVWNHALLYTLAIRSHSLAHNNIIRGEDLSKAELPRTRRDGVLLESELLVKLYRALVRQEYGQHHLSDGREFPSQDHMEAHQQRGQPGPDNL